MHSIDVEERGALRLERCLREGWLDPSTRTLVRGKSGRELWRSRGLCAFESRLGENVSELVRSFETVEAPAQGELPLGEGVWIRWRTLSLDWPGEEHAQLWTFDDISAEVLTRRALEDAQGKLRLLSAHTKGILFEFDADARFVRVWASDAKLLLRPESELIGQNLLEALGPEVGAWHHERVCHTLRTGEEQAYEYRVTVPSGATDFACTSIALPSLDGTTRGAVFWIRDVTEEVELRSKLQRADRLAAVGTLAAGVAHEINNPLGYMRLNLEHVLGELAVMGTDSALSGRVAPLTRQLEMVREGAERVHTIVSALLSLARAKDVAQIVDVRQTLERCLEVAAPEFEGRARVQRDYAAVPAVAANENRLIQVLSNLLTNAAQAMADGGGEHELSIVTRTDARGQAVVEIRDTGPGIAPENLARIFDPFFTTKPSGLGLGLAICQRIVASFGGEIDARNCPGGGAVFRVSLPAASAAVSPGAPVCDPS